MNDDVVAKDFLKALEKLIMEKPKAPSPVKKEKPIVELTQEQKRIIAEYHLSGVSKGIFEDCPEFWKGLSQDQVDDLYPSYRAASEKFMDELREHVLDLL